MTVPASPTEPRAVRPMLAPWRFVVLFGLVSLFADMVYEGARSIIGPFLATLGASAVVVGVAAGVGEFIGYGLRVVSGYLVSRSRHYWTWTIVGYALTVLSVPLIGVTTAVAPALLLYATQDYWHEVEARFPDDWPALVRGALALRGGGGQGEVVAARDGVRSG